MRKLATIQKIVAINEIPEADTIVVAQVLNWQVVIVKEYNYQVGDLVVYIEPDAWVPTEVAAFLSKDKEPREYNGIKGERLRTVRLRKQVSQGLVLPLSVLPDHPAPQFEGDDVSEILNIVKYEPPIPAHLGGLVKGAFPSVFPKTDEDRCQTFSNYEWEEKKQLQYEITEKLEGSSMSVGIIDGEFIVCSRNINLKEVEGNTFWEMARKYDIENKMSHYGLDNYIIQGECIGEGIQGNHYDIKGHDFYVFSMYDIERACYVSSKTRHKLCAMLELKHAPVIEECFEFMSDVTVSKVLEFADGNSALNRKKLREGLVFKQLDGQTHFKAVSSKYLLKTEN